MTWRFVCSHWGHSSEVMEVTGRAFNHFSLSFPAQRMLMYVSNARGLSEKGSLEAYNRQFVELDLTELFKVPKPVLL